MSGQDHEQSRFRRHVALARLFGAVEQIWPALWPSVAVLTVFLIVSLTGFWQNLPGWLHFLGLVGFLALFGWTVWRARRFLRMPDHAAGLGRLERTNALAHQPLRSLGDRLATSAGDAGSQTLWRTHRERMLRSLARLRIGAPRSDMPRRDPWALRAGLLLLLIAALAEAGGAAPERLAMAFDLTRAESRAGPPTELALWVTPPAYTGRPPVQLEAAPPVSEGEAPTEVVRVPEASEVLAQLHHAPAGEEFRLSLDESGQDFEVTGGQSAEATLTINRTGELKVARDDEVLGVWQVEAVPDLVPEIDFAQDPERTHRGVLKTTFRASDDYGVVGVALLLSRPDTPEDHERLELMRPVGGATMIEDSSYLDLTPHRWAGLPVMIRLEARDGIEQRGLSEPRELILPERAFEHPMARAVIEQRKRLADRPEDPAEVAAGLNRLSQHPELLREDPAVFMALRAAAQRLMVAPDQEAAVDEVLDLLWDTALHLEDGQLSLAERELRELQQALQDALEQGASDEELEQLMDQLEQAMQEYMEALARQAMEMAQNPDAQQTPIDPQAMQVTPQDLQSMLDQAREMMRTGAREAAQQMLAQLQEMLENLQMAQQGQMSAGQQMMNQLQEMIQRQQGLLDETYGLSQQGQQGQQGQEGQQGQQGQGQFGQQGQMGQGQQGQGQMGQGQQGQGQPGQMGQLAQGQEALRRALGALMQQLGEAGVPIPRSLGEAELAMRSARDALGQGQAGQALDPEAEALDQLRQGGQAMMDEMQRMMGQQPGQGPGQAVGQPFGQNPDGRDPLGRSMFNQGGADLYGERVPSELDLGRARAIMEELYRRAGERNRPSEELEYLRRLLERF